MVQLLNTSSYDLFLNLINSCKVNIKLCSPFIKRGIVDRIYENADTSDISVITNVNIMSLYKKSSDVSALRTILLNGGKVYNYQKLHAKIYIFDDKQAIITSANLTYSGLKSNFEYGVLIDEISLVENICKDFSTLSCSELSGKLNLKHIQEIQTIVDSIPKPPEVVFPNLQLDYEEDIEDLFDKDIVNIIDNLTGWKKTLFIALGSIDQQVFTTKDFPKIIPYLRQHYPANRNIEAKIRQQLQELRDLGLVKFEGNGVYKKLWI
ncbi:MAG: phospholipase D-like domain-containing protein [Syntrophomonadaceae bacterium]|nr:phospholipase D-like domain-containing protein [Syntrophomonadaceae bacterium]